MKEIFNGRLYDTDTARVVFTTSGYNDTFTLYRKRNGRFFKEIIEHGRGGYLEPMTLSEAKDLCIQVMSVDDYISEFGAVPE